MLPIVALPHSTKPFHSLSHSLLGSFVRALEMSSMLSGMGDSMKEAAKKKIEDEMGEKAPASIKPLFPCCGGPVGTMEKCICMVPADQQEQVKSAIEKYKSL